MDIEQDKIDGLLKLVQEAYPNWPDVDDPYLRAAINMAGRLLSQAELDRLLSAGQYDEIMKRLGDVAQAGEVLFLPGPKQGDLDILQQVTDPPGFCQPWLTFSTARGPLRSGWADIAPVSRGCRTGGRSPRISFSCATRTPRWSSSQPISFAGS